MASDVPSSYSDDAIRQQIRICLMRIKRDEAFVEGEGLASPDFQTIKKGKDENVKEKFIKYVSKSLQLKKKSDKSALKKRLLHDNLMETEIANFNPNTYVMEDDPAPSEKEQTGTKGNSAGEVEVGDKKDASAKKRRRSSSLKPGKESKKGRIAFKMSDSERRKLAKESKMEYLSQKADVLERVPESHKKHWGQIMFGKWKKDPWRPVLVLGPYQVHPDLRDTWMKMFENTKGDPQRMWYWCYWYGSPVGEAYTQQKVNTLMSYEKAVASNFHVPPPSLQAKLDAGKKLKGAEEQTMKGYTFLEEELKKKPEERIPETFFEDYQNILKLDDEVSLAADEDYDIESGDLDSESDEPASDPAPKKIAIAKKEKKVAVKKKKKKQPKAVVEPEVDPAVEPAPLVSSIPMEIDDAIGEAELSEGDDDEDEDFEKSIGGEEDEDDADLNYDEDEGPSRKKKKVSKREPSPKKADKQKKLQKKVPVDTEGASKKELKKLGAKTKQPREDLNPEKQAALEKKRERDRLRKRSIKEANDYEDCVKRYSSVAEELATAVESKDATKVVSFMKMLKKGVKDLTAPFIEDYKLAQLMKAAKAILLNEKDKQLRKELWEETKVVYEAKKKSVPEGWRARLTSSEPKHDETGENRKKRQETKAESGSHNEKSEVNGREGDEPTHATQLNTSRIDVEGESSVREVGRHNSGGDLEKLASPDRKGFRRGESDVSEGLEVGKMEVLQNTLALKPPKKKSGLSFFKNLFNPDKNKETTETPAETSKAPTSLTSGKTVSKKIPDWLCKVRDTDTAVELLDDRALGLEFFEETAKQFPGTVDLKGFARTLEAAAFAWVTSNATNTDGSAWKVPYWEKVHSIAGACGGKHVAGTLIAAIMDGKFGSAEEIMNLPDDVLFASFYGHPLNGSC